MKGRDDKGRFTEENKEGLKKIYTVERIQYIKALLEEYIENTEIPIIAEFAYMNKICRQTLYEQKPLSDTLEILRAKKEAQLERKGLENEINPTMAKFSLQQLGWRDRVEHDTKIQAEVKTDIDYSKLPDDVLRQIIEAAKY